MRELNSLLQPLHLRLDCKLQNQYTKAMKKCFGARALEHLQRPACLEEQDSPRRRHLSRGCICGPWSPYGGYHADAPEAPAASASMRQPWSRLPPITLFELTRLHTSVPKQFPERNSESWTWLCKKGFLHSTFYDQKVNHKHKENATKPLRRHTSACLLTRRSSSTSPVMQVGSTSNNLITWITDSPQFKCPYQGHSDRSLNPFIQPQWLATRFPNSWIYYSVVREKISLYFFVEARNKNLVQQFFQFFPQKNHKYIFDRPNRNRWFFFYNRSRMTWETLKYWWIQG